jgi:hypothetical protein
MKEPIKLVGMAWSPKNLTRQPFEVVSPQNPGDHESLSISRHVRLHVIFHPFEALVTLHL